MVRVPKQVSALRNGGSDLRYSAEVTRRLAEIDTMLKNQVQSGNIDKEAYHRIYHDISEIAARRIMSDVLSKYDLTKGLRHRLGVIERQLDKIIGGLA